MTHTIRDDQLKMTYLNPFPNYISRHSTFTRVTDWRVISWCSLMILWQKFKSEMKHFSSKKCIFLSCSLTRLKCLICSNELTKIQNSLITLSSTGKLLLVSRIDTMDLHWGSLKACCVSYRCTHFFMYLNEMQRAVTKLQCLKTWSEMLGCILCTTNILFNITLIVWNPADDGAVVCKLCSKNSRELSTQPWGAPQRNLTSTSSEPCYCAVKSGMPTCWGQVQQLCGGEHSQHGGGREAGH